MGTLAGHVAPGASFIIINLWQLFSLFLLRSGSYFLVRGIRHLELILIIIDTVISILMELVISSEKHRPFNADGTVPSNHLPNFEHVSISLGLLIFDLITIHMDRVRAANCDAIVIAVTLATTLLRIPCLRSFRVSLVWSASLVFQGIWFITMGVMLCTPLEEGHNIVRCRTNVALDRAKSLINLQFSWYLTGTIVFVIILYLQLTKFYPEEPQYVPLVKADSGRDSDNGRLSIGDEHDNDDDLKAAKCGFGQVVSGTRPMEIER
uniref:Uncharacterized protein n=1 Tax=Setaria viridis TaxID=4556 RepID=A0A4U6VTZ4_SETVI|nr:hypothetical protein SEVIR_2G232800v2 [Setaria viridis]